jgi:hypothetical protein
MTAWTSDELSKIGAAEELRIASLRRDGTLRNPVTIWVIRHGDDLYVRSVNGRTAAWFRGTQECHEGRIIEILFIACDIQVKTALVPKPINARIRPSSPVSS